VNVVDWVLLGALVVFAIAGWHRGFVAGLLSFVGFLGGGLVAALVLPGIVDALVSAAILRVIILGFGVLVCALLGQFAASLLGDRLRGAMSWRPVRIVDNAAGAALNVLALAIITWIVASALAYLPVSLVAQQVTESRVLVALDSLVPVPARNAFGSLRDLVGSTSAPRIFAGLAQVNGPEVDPPDGAAVTPAVDRAQDSVVEVVGSAPECQSSVSGSGFAIAADRVLTNAHVVAGIDRPRVRRHLSERGLPATVVYFDPQADVAVLAVPGLSARALALVPDDATTGDPAVIAGFPESGPYRVEPARVRTLVSALGDDIYGQAGVERDVYVVRGTVLPGNSGGPLLRPDGLVLGMVFGTDDNDEETGYALTSGQLRAAVDAGLRSGVAVDTGTCRIRN
jgi:S1-C subfamily serine protease